MDAFTIFLILFFTWFLYALLSYKECEIFIDGRLYVDTSTLPNSGYGVFTRGFIPKNTVIEIAHTIHIPAEEREYMSTILKYDFSSPNGYDTLIAMGYGGIYNNHKEPNVDWISTDKTIVYKTNKDVQSGEELFVTYGSAYFELHDMVEES